MGFSIYTSAFNCVKNQFPILDAVLNFSAFADELVVAVNKSEDETWDLFQEAFREAEFFQEARFSDKKCRMVAIRTDISYDDPLLDGKIKNAALQATTEKWKIGLDLDERIPLKSRGKWELAAKMMDMNKSYDAYLIPSVNLWGDHYHVRWDHEQKIAFKWYLHKGGLKRGPVNFGLNPNGTVDREKSDTCELIYPDGNLVRALPLVDEDKIHEKESYYSFLKNNLYVFHLGYADFKQKVHRYKNFWEHHWEVEAGIPHDKPLNQDQLSGHKTYPHNLPLWDE